MTTVAQSAPGTISHLFLCSSPFHFYSGQRICFPKRLPTFWELSIFPQNPMCTSVFSYLDLAVSSVTGGCAGFIRSFYWKLPWTPPILSRNKAHGPPNFQRPHLILHILHSIHIKACSSCVLLQLLSLFLLIVVPFLFAYCSSLDFPTHVWHSAESWAITPSGGRW